MKDADVRRVRLAPADVLVHGRRSILGKNASSSSSSYTVEEPKDLGDVMLGIKNSLEGPSSSQTIVPHNKKDRKCKGRAR